MNGKLKVAKLKVDPAWCDRFYDWSLFSYLGESMSTCDRRGCCPPSKSADTDFSSHELNRKPTQVMGQSCAAHSTPRHARWAYNHDTLLGEAGRGGAFGPSSRLDRCPQCHSEILDTPVGLPSLDSALWPNKHSEISRMGVAVMHDRNRQTAGNARRQPMRDEKKQIGPAAWSRRPGPPRGPGAARGPSQAPAALGCT